jgi:hypothetical protein
LIGNHEEMMGDCIRNGDKTWINHGANDTILYSNLSLQLSHKVCIKQNKYIAEPTSTRATPVVFTPASIESLLLLALLPFIVAAADSRLDTLITGKL